MKCPTCLSEMTRFSKTEIKDVIIECRHYCSHCRLIITEQPALGELRRLILQTIVTSPKRGFKVRRGRL